MTEKAKLAYLAGPVRALGRPHAIDVRKPMENYFVRRGWATFNPPGAWCGDFSEESEAVIKAGNDMVIAISDLLAVAFVAGVESVGTNAEVILAARLGLPIIIIVYSRDDVSDAIAWASPLMGEAKLEQRTSIEFAVMRTNRMDTVTVISYDPHREEFAS